MKIVEISSSKLDTMSELVEEMLMAGSELMHCISKIEDEMFGERGGSGRYSSEGSMMGERNMMGDRRRMGMRQDGGMDDWRDSQSMMGERRSYTSRRR